MGEGADCPCRRMTTGENTQVPGRYRVRTSLPLAADRSAESIANSTGGGLLRSTIVIGRKGAHRRVPKQNPPLEAS